MISYNQFIGLLKQIAEAHEQVRTFGEGDLWEIGASGDVAYPLMWAVVQPSGTDKKVLNLKMSLIFADLVHKDISNQAEATSDMLQVATDVLAQLKNPVFDDDFILSDQAQLTPFNDKFDDEVTGWKVDFTIKINYLSDRCAVPSSLFPVTAGDECGGGGSMTNPGFLLPLKYSNGVVSIAGLSTVGAPLQFIRVNMDGSGLEYHTGEITTVWRTGSAEPANTLGADGDYYLNQDNGDVYIKTSGAYILTTNIKGPKGDKGDPGNQGQQGATGPSFGYNLFAYYYFS